MKDIYKDAFKMLCGKQIGDGINRKVYECKLMPEWVVKVEKTNPNDFANIREKAFWLEYENDLEISKWLAPCGELSPDGKVMLQRKVEPLPPEYKLPKKLPEFLTDIKLSNFGLLDGTLVCVDYEYVVITPSTKKVEANWLLF